MSIKNILSQAKNKLEKVIEKGSSEIRRFFNTKYIKIYSKPVLGGFKSEKAFVEDSKLFFPVSRFDKDDVQINTIIGIDNDEEYYVIKEISECTVVKEITIEDKKYEYECYEVNYNILNDEFTNDVDCLPFYDLTKEQNDILEKIREEINKRDLTVRDKKEFCLNLWNFFVECIQYRLKNHYIVIAFSRIASDYVEDYSTYLINLFSL